MSVVSGPQEVTSRVAREGDGAGEVKGKRHSTAGRKLAESSRDPAYSCDLPPKKRWRNGGCKIAAGGADSGRPPLPGGDSAAMLMGFR